MVSLIAGQFLQHHGSPFYPLYTHSEAYTGDEDSTVHGGTPLHWSILLFEHPVYRDKNTPLQPERYSEAL